MTQALARENEHLLAEVPETDDPREVAGEWTRELARLTEEKCWVMSQLGQRADNDQDLARRLTLLNRQIALLHARISWLADHT